jgi:hypothetical protein
LTWSRAFDDPIPLPSGKPLRTLQEAADHILAPPKAEQAKPRWQTAVECLIMAAEGRGPVMFARIAMLRALNGVEPGASMVRPPPSGQRLARRTLPVYDRPAA